MISMTPNLKRLSAACRGGKMKIPKQKCERWTKIDKERNLVELSAAPFLHSFYFFSVLSVSCSRVAALMDGAGNDALFEHTDVDSRTS